MLPDVNTLTKVFINCNGERPSGQLKQDEFFQSGGKNGLLTMIAESLPG